MNDSKSSDHLVSPELRQLLHRVDALTPITPPPPSAVPAYVTPRSAPPRSGTLVAAMAVVAGLAGLAGLAFVAGIFPDRSPSLPVGPLSSLPEPAPPLELPAHELGERSCRDELATQATDTTQSWPTDIDEVVVFGVIDDPSLVRVALVGNDRAFLCTAERTSDIVAVSDWLNTAFDPDAVPRSTSIVVHASQFETTAELPVSGPGRIWITGRFGADVGEITYIAADGERTRASIQRDWFSLAASIGDGVPLDDGHIEVRTHDGTIQTIPTLTIEMNDVLD